MANVSLTGAALILLGALACRRQAPDASATPVPDTVVSAPVGGAPAVPAAIRISALVPDSIRFMPNALHEVVIRGTGFLAAGAGLHTVRIGPVELRGVPANVAGSEIRVTLPERYVPPGGGPPRPLMAGTYDVTVTAGSLTSNIATFRVIP